jgi:hypothetical protein
VRTINPDAPRPKPIELSPETMLNRLRNEQDYRYRYAARISHDYSLVDGVIRWMPNTLTLLLACQLAESYTDFHIEFSRLVARKGYDVVQTEDGAVDAVPVTKDDVKDASAAVRHTENKTKEAMLDSLKQMDANDLENARVQAEQAHASDQANEDDCVALPLLRVWKAFPGRFRDITLEEVDYADRHMGFFVFHQWLLDNGHDTTRFDLDALRSASINPRDRLVACSALGAGAGCASTARFSRALGHRNGRVRHHRRTRVGACRRQPLPGGQEGSRYERRAWPHARDENHLEVDDYSSLV